MKILICLLFAFFSLALAVMTKFVEPFVPGSTILIDRKRLESLADTVYKRKMVLDSLKHEIVHIQTSLDSIEILLIKKKIHIDNLNSFTNR